MSLDFYQMRANTVIRASAGTGKTYTLVETALHLLSGLTHRDEPLRPRDLVAITFTERAAGEMLERIRRRLGQLASGAPEASVHLRASAEQLGRPLPDPAFFAALRGEIDELRVATFHGFCLSLLQRYPLEAGLDPAFGVYDEEAGVGRVEELVELELLGALQEGTERAALQDLLALVGLGSQDFKPGLVEMLPRVLDQVREAGMVPTDLHRFLRDSAAGNGTEHDDDEAAAARLVIGLLERIHTRFQLEKARLAQIDFADMQLLARRLLQERVDVRDEVKARIGVLMVDEFQDTNPVQRDLTLLLAEDPGSSEPWSGPEAVALGERRLFVVGDPKQAIYDFRGADVSIFHDVEALIRAQRGQVFSLATSYRSRPALVEATNTYLARLLGAPGRRPEPWSVAWSDDAALTADRPERLQEPALHLLDTSSLCLARVDAGASTRTRVLQQSEEFAAVVELILATVQGDRPLLVDSPDGPRRARFADVTILLRRVRGALGELQHQLERRGVPYYVVKGGGFFAAREVSDLAQALRAVADPSDSASVAAWLRGPLVALSDDALARVALAYGRRITGATLDRAARDEELAAALLPADREALPRAARLLSRLSDIGERIGSAAVLEQLLAETDFAVVLAAAPGGDQALANVERVLELAYRYTLRWGNSLAGFSRFLQRLVEREPRTDAMQTAEEHQDVVRIMSIHQAKGLECPIAIVPEAHREPIVSRGHVRFSPRHGLGIKLDERSSRKDTRYARIGEELRSREQAEHRRLMYVAATRARDHLVITGEAAYKRAAEVVSAVPAKSNKGWYQHALELGVASPWLARVPVEPLLDRLTLAHRPPATPPPLEAEGVLRRARAAFAEDAPREAFGGELVSVVTQLADFALCPRRYWLSWEVGMPQTLRDPQLDPSAVEALPASDQGGEIRWPADPLDLGTLAHALLEHVDATAFRSAPSAARAEGFEAVATRLGTGLDEADRRAVYEAVERALLGPLGDILGGDYDLERERAFVLHVPIDDPHPESGLLIRGRMDLLAVGADGVPLVVDYKYAAPARSAEAHAFQLRTYALAVHRRAGSPPHGRYRAGIVYLRSPAPELVELAEGLDAAALEGFARTLAELGAALLRARHSGRWPRLAPEAFDDVCARTHCRFRRACFPDRGIPTR